MRGWRRAIGVAVCVGCSYACGARHVVLVPTTVDERAVVEDLRSLAAAEEAYRGTNFGFFDTPECVAAPAKCIPWYQRVGPVVLPPSAALVSRRHGYVWRFVPGRAPTRSSLPEDASRSSLLEWAYTAVPADDKRSGPAYCVDSAQRLCRYLSRAALRREQRHCPEPCGRVE